MSPERKALGRGLSSLLSVGKGGHAVLHELPISSISPNRNQPRKRMDPGKLASLAASIKEHGVETPVIVRRTGSGFELIAGERRWRAAREAGLRTIPAVVRDASDQQALILARSMGEKWTNRPRRSKPPSKSSARRTRIALLSWSLRSRYGFS